MFLQPITCRGDGLSTLVVLKLKATLSSFSSISPVLPLELIPVLTYSVPHFPWQPDPGLPTGLEMNHHHFQLPRHSVSFTPPSQEFNTTFPCQNINSQCSADSDQSDMLLFRLNSCLEVMAMLGTSSSFSNLCSHWIPCPEHIATKVLRDDGLVRF